MNSEKQTFLFKDEFSYENRLTESSRIMSKYHDRIPVIIEKGPNTNIAIDKRKYLVPKDLTIGQLIHVIRKRIKLKPEKALFLFINNMIPPTSTLMHVIYEEHKSDDNFLYIRYCFENTFG